MGIMLPPRVCLFGIATMALVLIGFTIYTKGDVKAGVKMLGIELVIDAKDSEPKTQSH
jgi:hypothetical protein